MSEPVDPRVAYAVTAEPEPQPSPSPGPSPGPDPDPRPSPSPAPEPSPSPSGPSMPPPFGSEPDVGVTPSFLRGRADACDAASEKINKTNGVAEDASEDLARAAPGWSFVDSIDDMHHRWEELNREVTRRLDYASESFRRSADAYEANETLTAAEFTDMQR